jgi:hypothetical protein
MDLAALEVNTPVGMTPLEPGAKAPNIVAHPTGFSPDGCIKNMKTKSHAFIIALLGVAAALPAHADNTVYAYEWTRGGSVIFLDAPESAVGGGSYSEVVSADLLGNWVFGTGESSAQNSGFTWNATEITSMSLAFTDGFELDQGILYPIAGDAQAYLLDTIHAEGQYDFYQTGSWLATSTVPVPDAAPAGLLLLIGLAGVAVMFDRRRCL